MSWGQVDTSLCVYVCGQHTRVFRSRESKENLVLSTCAQRSRVGTKQRYVQSVLEALEKRTITSSQSGGRHKAYRKGDKAGHRRLERSWPGARVGLVMVMVLNCKLWSGTFGDKSQTFGRGS